MQHQNTDIRSGLVAFAASLETAIQPDGGRLSPAASLALGGIAAWDGMLAGMVDPASALVSGGIDASAFFNAIDIQGAEPLFGSLSLPDLLRGLADIEAGRTSDADAAIASLQTRRAGEAAS